MRWKRLLENTIGWVGEGWGEGPESMRRGRLGQEEREWGGEEKVRAFTCHCVNLVCKDFLSCFFMYASTTVRYFC